MCYKMARKINRCCGAWRQVIGVAGVMGIAAGAEKGLRHCWYADSYMMGVATHGARRKTTENSENSHLKYCATMVSRKGFCLERLLLRQNSWRIDRSGISGIARKGWSMNETTEAAAVTAETADPQRAECAGPEDAELYAAGLPGDCSDLLTADVVARLARLYRLAD